MRDDAFAEDRLRTGSALFSRDKLRRLAGICRSLAAVYGLTLVKLAHGDIEKLFGRK